LRHSCAECTGQTGVEMEALTACSVALLTICDMSKAVDRGMTISGLRLMEKHGGGRAGISWQVDVCACMASALSSRRAQGNWNPTPIYDLHDPDLH
jgi:hypothetical protein